MEAPGGVENDDVVALATPGFEGAAGDRHRPLAGDDRQRGNTDLAAELRQLLLRRRPLHIERGHQHLLAFAGLQAQRDLRGGRGLARALQPDQHDRDRRGRVEVEPIPAGRRRAAAEHLDQMIVNDLDDHLAGGDRAQHLLPGRPLAHRGDEVAHHRQGDVGL